MLGGLASAGIGSAAAKGALKYGGEIVNSLGLGKSKIAQYALGTLSDAAFSGGISAANEYAKAAAYGDSYEEVATDGKELAKDMLFQAAVGFLCRTLTSSFSRDATGQPERTKREYFKDVDNLDDLAKAFKQYGRQYHPDRYATADAATQKEMSDIFARISAEYNAVKAELAVESAGQAAKSYSDRRNAKTPEAAEAARRTAENELMVLKRAVENGTLAGADAVEAVQIMEATLRETPQTAQQNTMPAQPAAAQEGAQGVGEGNLTPVPQNAAQGAQEASTSVDTNPKNHTPEEQKRVESAFMSKEKGSTGTVLNMENISPQVTPEAPQRANASFDNTVPQESGGVKAQEGTESAQTAQADNTTTAGGMNHGGQEVQNHAGGAEFADTAKRGTPEAADAARALPDGAAERGERERGGRESGRIPREVRNVGGEDGNALTVQKRLEASGISQFISPREANVPNGASGSNTVTIFEETDWDPELINAANWAKSKGVKKVTALLGVINIEKNGRTGKAFGVFNADTGEIFVNAGSVQRSVSETIEHETAHYLAEVARRENVRTFMHDVQSRYSSEEWGKVYDAYFDRYAALTGDYVGMSENDIELYVWEEIMGDAYAEIDQYDEKASRFNREAENALSQSGQESESTLQRERATSAAEQGRETAAATERRRGPPERFSLNEFEDGRRFVDVQADQAQFDGLNDKQKTKLAIQIIKERFSGKVIGIDNRVFVNGRSAAEYGHPTKNISSDIRDAKMRASTELDNLIDAGTNFRTEPDGKDGHIHHNAAGDFRYFDTTFKVGNEYYKGVVNILPVSKGLLLKDITKIESITQDISSSYGQSPKSTFLRDASMSSISRNGGNVKYSAFN